MIQRLTGKKRRVGYVLDDIFLRVRRDHWNARWKRHCKSIRRSVKPRCRKKLTQTSFWVVTCVFIGSVSSWYKHHIEEVTFRTSRQFRNCLEKYPNKIWSRQFLFFNFVCALEAIYASCLSNRSVVFSLDWYGNCLRVSTSFPVSFSSFSFSDLKLSSVSPVQRSIVQGKLWLKGEQKQNAEIDQFNLK